MVVIEAILRCACFNINFFILIENLAVVSARVLFDMKTLVGPKHALFGLRVTNIIYMILINSIFYIVTI